jgi:hypothetical protein
MVLLGQSEKHAGPNEVKFSAKSPIFPKSAKAGSENFSYLLNKPIAAALSFSLPTSTIIFRPT